jgi:hypothetical protein
LGTEVWNDYSSFGETSHFTNKVNDQEVEGGRSERLAEFGAIRSNKKV